MTRYYLACDLGAESGRLILGSITGQQLFLEEIHRFSNTPIKSDDGLLWNIPGLFEEFKEGLKKAGARRLPLSGISTDSWGVDYLLFDQAGTLLSPTHHYRDPRCHQGVELVNAKVAWPEIFDETGIQFMPINTLYQLATEPAERLAQSGFFLGVGDGFNYLLSGKPCAEESLASTTQLYNPRTRRWSDPLLDRLGWPRRLFPEIVPSGTRLGPLRPPLAEATGLSQVEVIASCSHDTAAAVAAVPSGSEHSAYLSSGTWSLMGVERTEPIINENSRQLNFTNEIGFGSTVRLLKNIIGLWIVQECRRDWAQRGREYDYAELTALAEAAPPFLSLINPGDARFLSPDAMPAKITAFCCETRQPEPESPGACIRCVLESLALLYRHTLRQIEQLVGHPIDRLHIVGGGAKNDLLNQFTADATQVPVHIGPFEATAAGNILVQAIALGHLPSLAAAREVVRHSTELSTVQPKPDPEWDTAYRRLRGWLA